MGLGYEANVSSDYSIHLSCGNGALGEFTASTNHTICLTGGDVGINEGTPDISDGYGLHIDGKILRLEDSKTPASAGATGNVGEICWDADYLYICTAANTWERAAIATW